MTRHTRALAAGMAIVFLSAVAPTAQRTREQKYADWATDAFPASEFESRRRTLVEHLLPVGGVFLTPAASGASDGFTFRQLDTFWYLSGLEVPDAVLAIDVDRASATLYAPVRDGRFENPARPNDFPGRPLQPDPALTVRSGIRKIKPIDQLERDLGAWVSARRVLQVDPGVPGPVGRSAPTPFQRVSPLQHFASWLVERHPSARVESAHSAVARTRMVKTAAETAVMRRAARLGVDGIAHAAGFVKVGVDERTLEAEFEAFCKRGGAERLPFASIIKSGPNSLWPWRILATHNDRRNRQLRDGELVIFDVGCELNGYVSDTGRTFPVSGTFSPSQRAILAMEVAVSDALIAALRPGVTLREAQLAGASAIPPDARPYMQTGLFFGHHLGLSAGDPSLDDAPMAPGMIVTVEPWYYNHDRDIAVFTEDVILITPAGRENLTGHVARSPEGIESLMRRRRSAPGPGR
ncbi:MAG: Xaa-Pro peptidase family protein [Vicinamibacterales bacterium]